ncbi:MAG: Glycoside hydrolase family 3 domain protein [candidate division TM6 bacterium GW2011_GWF2_37_49]|nr:MAG: Glycoside hydrolase family 3 domain protein [candidate division TM6 bacterium GW2011_GWF2_37_49]
MKFKKLKICLVASIIPFTYNFADQNTVLASDVGKHFILTLPKYSQTSEYNSWLEQTKPAGVMLTEPHMQNRSKTKEICKLLQDKAKDLGIYPLLISVDFEGGIVSRGADVNGFVSVPSPYKLAQLGKAECYSAGKLIGHQLDGINVDFAPSLDLFDPANYILATRCFAADSKSVVDCGLSFINGLLSEGVLPVIKHFPGLKSGKFDTHTDNVQIKLSDEEFEANVEPFRQVLEQKIDVAVMVGHARYDQFGPDQASTNANVVAWIKKHNSDALLITDDCSMQSFHRSPDKSMQLDYICRAAQKSIKNGFDLLIFSASPDDQIKMIKKLSESSFDSKYDIRSKIKAIVQRLSLNVPSDIDERRVSQELAKKVVSGNVAEIPITNKVLVLSVDLNKIRPATSFQTLDDKASSKKKTLLMSLFESEKYHVSEIMLDPMSADSIQDLSDIIYHSQFQNSDNVVLQTLNKNQQEWLRLLKHYCKKLTIVSLGHPYEKTIIPDAQSIELGSFHSSLINAAFDQLKKKLY